MKHSRRISLRADNLSEHSDLILEWILLGYPKLQFKFEGDSDWKDVIGEPCWTASADYRFKPVTVWVNSYTTSGLHCHPTKKAAQFAALLAAESAPADVVNYIAKPFEELK